MDLSNQKNAAELIIDMIEGTADGIAQIVAMEPSLNLFGIGAAVQFSQMANRLRGQLGLPIVVMGANGVRTQNTTTEFENLTSLGGKDLTSPITRRVLANTGSISDMFAKLGKDVGSDPVDDEDEEPTVDELKEKIYGAIEGSSFHKLDTAPQKTELELFKERVLEIESMFSEGKSDNKAILDFVKSAPDQLALRGLAKKWNIPDYETHPLNNSLLDYIRVQMKALADDKTQKIPSILAKIEAATTVEAVNKLVAGVNETSVQDAGMKKVMELKGKKVAAVPNTQKGDEI